MKEEKWFADRLLGHEGVGDLICAWHIARRACRFGEAAGNDLRARTAKYLAMKPPRMLSDGWFIAAASRSEPLCASSPGLN